MVLLIMIPMKNGYFIGNIPNIFRWYSHIRFPIHHQDTVENHEGEDREQEDGEGVLRPPPGSTRQVTPGVANHRRYTSLGQVTRWGWDIAGTPCCTQKWPTEKKVTVIFAIPVPGVHFFAIRRYRNLDGLDPVTPVTWLQQSKLQAHITKRKYLRRMPQDKNRQHHDPMMVLVR